MALAVLMLDTLEDSHSWMVPTTSLPAGAREGDTVAGVRGSCTIRKLGRARSELVQVAKFWVGETITEAEAPDLQVRIDGEWPEPFFEVLP